MNIVFNLIIDFLVIVGLVNLKELDVGIYFVGNIYSWVELKEIIILELFIFYGVSVSVIFYISVSNLIFILLLLYDVNVVDLFCFFSVFWLRSFFLYLVLDVMFYCW